MNKEEIKEKFRFNPENYREAGNSDFELILSTVNSIVPPSEKFMEEAAVYCDSLCKPLGSLGVLENMYVRISGIFDGKIPRKFKKAVIVYSADNGICEEGISSNPQEVTERICHNILKGTSGLCRLSEFYGADVFLEDLGVINDIEGHTAYKINRGSRNSAAGPALTLNEAIEGIAAGIKTAEKLIRDGYNLIGAGEMGVGNTATSSTVLSVITGNRSETTTGYGSGLTKEDYGKKIETVRKAAETNAPYKDVLDVMAKVGGLDICAMAGCYLACAAKKIPFILDGVISMAAMMCASLFSEQVKSYGFSSHRTVEKGARLTEELLEINPPLDLMMRLGEGSGCPPAMNLMEASVFTLGSMATFEDVAVDKNDYVDIRKGEKNHEENV